MTTSIPLESINILDAILLSGAVEASKNSSTNTALNLADVSANVNHTGTSVRVTTPGTVSKVVSEIIKIATENTLDVILIVARRTTSSVLPGTTGSTPIITLE